ncbi:MAG: hypothetical protein KBT34_07040 [Prevotella sp.]|nr:hypothetical protein [Candidatus Prevotella equi]
MNNFNNINSSRLLNIILLGDKQSDEAMYYLLHDRLYKKLEDKFNVQSNKNNEDLADVLDDFFLYLREGKGNSAHPYSVLSTIKNKGAFEAWVVSTFRNFLYNKFGKKQYTLVHEQGNVMAEDNNVMDKEELISKASILIAYSHQSLTPRNQFLFLRALLTLLNKGTALPDKDMAEAMGMSHVLYRVTTHRIMQNVAKNKKSIESGVKFNLDSYHTAMAESINNDFDTLYSTLIRYYDSTLSHLENVSAIRKLRKEYYNTTGVMLHEDIAVYGSLSIYSFYNKLNRCINQRSAA